MATGTGSNLTSSSGSDRLKVLIVGAGDMATRHIEGWRTSGLADVEAVVDVDSDRLRAFMTKHEIPNGHADYCSMINKLQPDVVSICVPAVLHPEVTQCAADAGAHVLCEKPIALNVSDARAMIEACRRNNVLLGIDFQRRFGDTTRFYNRMVSEEVFGRPLIWRQMDLREVRPKTMMHEKFGNGGSIVDCAVHWFDQWRCILGADPVRVFARGGVFGRGKERLKNVKEFATDTGLITVEYDSGDTGEVCICWGLPEETPSATSLTVFGPEAVARNESDRIVVQKGRWTTEEKLEATSWDPMIHGFAQAVVEGRNTSPVSGEDGLVALKAALAAVRSIEEGRPVELAEITD